MQESDNKVNFEELQSEINALNFTATYSVEDNKLRLYAARRLSSDLYKIVKASGFVYAPKQELFVAPMWTPNREDLCVKLAGEITGEDMTMVERAAIKAERLDGIAQKRKSQASAYHNAANRISERFAAGQPILVGHHSERKARRDKSRMDSAMSAAIKASEAVSYWGYRAEGVERHANRKANDGVRARRIKTLLAELRDRQRDINQAHKALALWEKIDALTDAAKRDEVTLSYAGSYIHAPQNFSGDSVYDKLNKKLITTDEAINICIEFQEYQATSAYTLRWISHILNRLAYERGELGEVARYTGDLTPVILQAFAREQGTDKPTATKTDYGFLLSSDVPLPLHIGEGQELELTNDEWRDLMQSTGYAVEIKERKASAKQTCSLISPTKEDAQKLQDLWNADAARSKHGSASEIREVTQAFYSANSGGDYSHFYTIELDENGKRIWPSRKREHVAVCRVRVSSGGALYAADKVLVITDKPQKALPFNFADLQAARAQVLETAEA